ncbi:spore coat protein [Mangrovibacillus cuniculi]|uniref:Spore coat protein n=1 Tax=Mangrovibacillus cuniculi TaxID=2593652 RepID=A0A7S8CEI7_9BACI|nr:spore coat protein [Mangrovibacillus cuniculi]QPC48462.1 spore coat protein [Mangrovibacillus cuniculi]
MNQQQQPTAGGMPSNQNHGGHELFDAHETIAGIINVLDQFQLFEQHIQDPELKQICQRQHQYTLQVYNTMVNAFRSGQKPSIPTTTYEMGAQDWSQVQYGIQPTQPKKPNQSVQDISDNGVSAYMLGLMKTTSSLLSMTALEMTNPTLRRILADSVPNFIEMSYEIFLYQNKHKYYQAPQLQPQDAQTMINSYVPVQGNGTIH